MDPTLAGSCLDNHGDGEGELRFAYYCSGHGYGHATRVSAFARHLLNLQLKKSERLTVYIVSSAPKHVFSDSIASGALYRYAEIDPVIVQPLAYCVDRQKSVEVLKAFLAKKDEFLQREKKWLLEIKAHCVLSDAAFLGCLSAKAARIPSVLITNFSFDSVYSFLSSPILDEKSADYLQPKARNFGTFDDLASDAPITLRELEPLVEQIHSGYCCADLLVLLPGYIPIPSFFKYPSLPSSTWVNTHSRRMHPEITNFLLEEVGNSPPLPALLGSNIPRSVIRAPLLVRSPDPESLVYTPQGRSKFLKSIGVPSELHHVNTKILIVSFGGQNFHQPSRSTTKPHSRTCSMELLREGFQKLTIQSLSSPLPLKDHNFNESNASLSVQNSVLRDTVAQLELHIPPPPNVRPSKGAPRITTDSHISVPGAPPACNALASPTKHSPRMPTTPALETVCFQLETDRSLKGPYLLPDESWIAVVCGVSKEQWLNQDEELPQGFYVAPRDIYMPDLTAIGDVLLGKLGYGTVSECVDACTPFVYVSRPLFIEEHGLRLLLERDGVGIELSRHLYEAGDWAATIDKAWAMGKSMKETKRLQVLQGIGTETRDQEGSELAKTVVNWVRDWKVKPKGVDYPLADNS